MIHEMKHLNGPYPNFCILGTITSHHPTSHLEVWLHVLPLPTWLKIFPYWTSLLESTYPLILLSASAIMVAPQLAEATSEVPSKAVSRDAC